MEKAQIAVVGLAVMGENLALNMERNGFRVVVYNRTVEKVDRFLAGRGAGKRFVGAHSVQELTEALARPRILMLMIRQGAPVDAFIEQVRPYLEAGDILIDGGNSNFEDTRRRAAALEAQGIGYLGCGVSGGEEGALLGPSLMPGGSRAAWEAAAPILTRISAKTPAGEPCCGYIGRDGAGHFVKMVHNGIEYGDMQIICEAYQILRDVLHLPAEEIGEVFAAWNGTELNSYLVEITANILQKQEDGVPVVDRILDTAGQKGTGKWAGICALQEGIPLTLIGEAVFARCLSAAKEERLAAEMVFPQPKRVFSGDKAAFLEALRQSVYAAKIVSYAQGFALIRQACKTYGWEIDCAQVAKIWRAGCIIRSGFLDRISEAYARDAALLNLLLDDYFADCIRRAEAGWRQVASEAARQAIPIPAISSALSYFDGYRCGRLPANLLQAQRDYFGAHTYERVDAPRGQFFHTDWTGHGGATAASEYSV